jgi:hypothetical protein
MLNFVHKALSSCHRFNKKKKNINNNKNSPDPPKRLLLIHLPTELLSKIILELLNEWALARSFKFSYLRGLLDTIETLPELSTNHMIPLVQVNKFFYDLVWTITLSCSYWNQEPKNYGRKIRDSTIYRSRPFVFIEDMLQSRGIEPVNQFHLQGSLSPNQLRLVRHVIFQETPFLVSSVGTGLQRFITISKLQSLTTLKIDTWFVERLAHRYKDIDNQFWKEQIKYYGSFKNLSIKLPPFIVNCIKQVGNGLCDSNMIIAYYNLLIFEAIVNMISSLDHPVSFAVVDSGLFFLEVNCLITIFAEHNMISQIHSLVIFPCRCISCKDCMRFLALLKPEHLIVWEFSYRYVTEELATILIEHNPNLRKLQMEDMDFQHLNFPSNLEMLKTSNYSIFSNVNLPLGQKFTNLIEFGLDFQSQVDNKYIKSNLLHIPTLQTLRVSGELLKNIELVICLVESNPTVTSLSVYYEGYYEHLEPLYRSMRSVKLLDISYKNRHEQLHTLDFNLASILDVILRNTSSLAMILIHKHNQTGNLSFKSLAAKLGIEYEMNTRHLRYINIYNGRMNAERSDVSDLIPMFFDNRPDDGCEMSPYDAAIKKLYRIDGALWGKKVDAERCRLELDVRGIRKIFQISK